MITQQQALEALDSMDDFARMDIGVDAFGPRETLRQYIEQQAEDAQAELKKVWVISYNGVLQPTIYYTEDEAAREVKRRQDEYLHDKSPRAVVPLWTAPTQTHKAEDAELLEWLEEAYTRGGYDQGRDWREFMSDVAQQGFRTAIRAAMAQERQAPPRNKRHPGCTAGTDEECTVRRCGEVCNERHQDKP